MLFGEMERLRESLAESLHELAERVRRRPRVTRPRIADPDLLLQIPSALSRERNASSFRQSGFTRTVSSRKRRRPSSRFELFAGGLPDVADHGAALADDDPLLPLALHDDRGGDDRQVLVLGLVDHGLDQDGVGERQLVPRPLEELLADDLRDPLGLGGRRQEIRRGTPAPPPGGFAASTSKRRSTLSPVRAETGTTSRKRGRRPRARRSSEAASPCGSVDLVEGQDRRSAGLRHEVGDEALSRPALVGRVHDEENEVGRARARRSRRGPSRRSAGTRAGGCRACRRERSPRPAAGRRPGCACAWSAACPRRSRPSRRRGR